MRILGIDYGSKRVGLATCDTLSGIAFPRSVINNDKELLKTISEIKKKENIAKIATAGANTFILGSAIFKSTDYAKTLIELHSALNTKEK